MAQKPSRHRSPPDFRHRSQIPMSAVADVAQRLFAVLSPSLLAPRQLERRDPRQPQRLIRMRQRLLTLPVLGAIIVSLVWRRIPAVAEVQRGLAREGLWWTPPLPVSPHAITKRRDVMPAAVMGPLCAEVWARLQAQVPPPLPHQHWAAVRARCPLLASVDGSMLEALRKKAQVLREQPGLELAGKVLVMVEVFSHRPLGQDSPEDALANDKRFAGAILAALPPGGWLVFDLGFFSLLWFDAFTDAAKCFVTRLREKTADRTVQVLSRSPDYRDESIQMGQYRATPCRHPLRLVSVLWQGAWYRYLTKVLEPQGLSARQVDALYRHRGWIADAVAPTKRLLDVADVWTGARHAVQVPLYATLMVYAGLGSRGQQAAQALGDPLERLSVARVFRAFDH
jgi:hypothetical protein